MNAASIESTIRAALDNATNERVSGCGRVYVTIVDKGARRHVKSACAALGMRYLTSAYGTAGQCIYIGYDNATGRELGRGTAVANALRAIGIDCYRDEVGD